MELQLKNVYFSERLSEETNAFTADIFFQGKKVGYAKNDGQGGCTNITHYPEQREGFRKAEEYATTLPKIVYEGRGGLKGFEVDSNLENQVDRLFENWVNKKEIQKYEKKGLFFQEPNGRRSTISWKGFTIKKLLEHPQGKDVLQKKILKLQKEGNTILNTNLGSILPQK
jgi:hypothetical protein